MSINNELIARHGLDTLPMTTAPPGKVYQFVYNGDTIEINNYNNKPGSDEFRAFFMDKQSDLMLENMAQISSLSQNKSYVGFNSASFLFAIFVIFVVMQVTLRIGQIEDTDNFRSTNRNRNNRLGNHGVNFGYNQAHANEAQKRKLAVNQKNLLAILDALFKGQKPPDNYEIQFSKNLKNVLAFVTKSKHRFALKEILTSLIKQDRFGMLQNSNFMNAIGRMAQFEDKFLNNPADFCIEAAEPPKEFEQLLSFLLVKYPVPVFLKSAFFQNHLKIRKWFVAIAQGESLRELEGLPFSLSKKAAPFVWEAPEHLNPFQAFRYAQIRGFGADHDRALFLSSSLIEEENEGDETFWNSFLLFAINQGLDCPQDLALILNYVRYQRTHDTNFKLKGRTLKRLLEQADSWLEKTGRMEHNGEYMWSKSGLLPYSKVIEGEKWFVRELRSSNELVYEGDSLNHCVAEYDHSCYEGNIAIFSIRKAIDGRKNGKPIATVSVTIPNKRLSEVGANCNQPVKGKTLEVYNQWAALNGVDILPA